MDHIESSKTDHNTFHSSRHIYFIIFWLYWLNKKYKVGINNQTTDNEKDHWLERKLDEGPQSPHLHALPSYPDVCVHVSQSGRINKNCKNFNSYNTLFNRGCFIIGLRTRKFKGFGSKNFFWNCCFFRHDILSFKTFMHGGTYPYNVLLHNVIIHELQIYFSSTLIH